MSPPLPKEEIKHIQRTIGSILYYARTVDPTILTKNTMQKTKQLLDYPVTCTEATVDSVIPLVRHDVRRYPVVLRRVPRI
jgi:hypothetical protein